MNRRRRNTILAALEKLRRLEPGVTLTHVLTFLYVSENEGLNVSELADVCRMTRATASRISRALATKQAHGALKPYLGLIEMQENPADVRGRVMFLTEAGQKLRAELDALIAQAIPIHPCEDQPLSSRASDETALRIAAGG